MGVAYSQDLRYWLMAALWWTETLAGRYDAGAAVSGQRVVHLQGARRRRGATGDVTAHKSGGGPKPKLAAYDEGCAPRWRRKPTSRSSSCKPGSPTITR